MGDIKTTRSYNFNSVGQTVTEFQQVNRTNELPDSPIGIRTPITLGGINGGLFIMHHNMASQIKDNFRNLLMTNHGERLGLCDFGANLRELTIELGSEAADNEAMSRISTAVNKYMPYVSLGNFETSDNAVEQTIPAMTIKSIKISYSIPLLEIIDQGIEILLYSAG